MSAEKPVPRFFLGLLLASAVVLALVIVPVASELFLAAVLAGALWPLQQWLTRKVRRRGIAAGILTIGMVVLLVGPIATTAAFLISDGSEGVKFVSEAMHSEDVARLVSYLPEPAQERIDEGIAALPVTLEQLMSKLEGYADTAASAVGKAISATSSFAFHAAMMFIALFFFLVRGHELVEWLDTVSPLGRGQTNELLNTFRRVSYAVIVSSVVTSAVQAAAGFVGFLIARVPSPVFFTALTFFFAFIPAIGAAVVCVIAALLLVVTGHPYMAIFLAAWGLIVVGLADNLVKPLLIRRGLEIHGAVVFFALIGGLAAFGAIGLLAGPLAVSAFLALLRMYHRDYTPDDTRVPSVPGLPRPGPTVTDS